MDWTVVGQITFGAVAAAATVIKLADERQYRTRRRRQVLTDLDIRDRLDDGSPARIKLNDFINETVEALIVDEEEKQRSWSGVVLAVFVLAGGVALGRQAWVGEYGFLADFGLIVASLFLLLLGAVGLAQSATRQVRDAKGRVLRGGGSS